MLITNKSVKKRVDHDIFDKKPAKINKKREGHALSCFPVKRTTIISSPYFFFAFFAVFFAVFFTAFFAVFFAAFFAVAIWPHLKIKFFFRSRIMSLIIISYYINASKFLFLETKIKKKFIFSPKSSCNVTSSLVLSLNRSPMHHL
jgi:hypothetical protein